MKNDAVRMLELVEKINNLVERHCSPALCYGLFRESAPRTINKDKLWSEVRQDWLNDRNLEHRIQKNVFGVCLLCEFEGRRQANLDHPFWIELWRYLEPHADVQSLQKVYANLDPEKCLGWSGKDLMRLVAEHMLPVAVPVGQ